MPRIVNRNVDEIASEIKKDLAEGIQGGTPIKRSYHLFSNGVLIVKSYEEDGSIKDARKVRIVVDGTPSAAEWKAMENG